MSDSFEGLLFIGDPHLSSRVPGFRKDNYPEVVLAKLIWVLNYAQDNRLLPVILGDLFHWPRDNANWLVVRLIDAIGPKLVLGIVGNHDTTLHELQEDDTLAILETAGSIKLVDRTGPWSGEMNGRKVLIGGSTWSERLPKHIGSASSEVTADTLVAWLAHHDIAFAGYENNARYAPYEIPEVDLLVNGHIHTPSQGITVGRTTWLNPGNISRLSRGSSHRTRAPGAMRVDVSTDGWSLLPVEIPHQAFDEVFYSSDLSNEAATINVSAFVQGLDKLRALRTASGEGLLEFLETNLQDDDSAVRDEIMDLAREVLENEHA